MASVLLPTIEQLAVINDDMRAQCVVACPGSGKTTTAVRRLLAIRKQLKNSRQWVGLLSYSNVAVETFRNEYGVLARDDGRLQDRVFFGTLDSFLTTFVLRPHAARHMKTVREPYLVSGSEPFLNSFKVPGGTYPHPIGDLTFSIAEDGELAFRIVSDGTSAFIPSEQALDCVERLGAAGAYTHELGRFWALRALVGEPRLLSALSRRFPFLIVDEAQDVGTAHAAILSLLVEAKATLSLLGDPHQAIYEFAGADGSFLREFALREGVQPYAITENKRSSAAIVTVANNLAGSGSKCTRDPDPRFSGAFYFRYDEANYSELPSRFAALVGKEGYEVTDAVILARGRTLVSALTGSSNTLGVSATGDFALAALVRDRDHHVGLAFEHATAGVVRLLANARASLRSEVVADVPNADVRVLRRLVWRFVRSSLTGLPPATLKAKSSWQPKLKSAVSELLDRIEAASSFRRGPTWTKSLTTRSLVDVPLLGGAIEQEKGQRVRIDTVHKAKGESISAVMYMAKKDDLSAMLAGTMTEQGRIGYVALTRSRDLFILAIPSKTKPEVEVAIEVIGLAQLPSDSGLP